MPSIRIATWNLKWAKPGTKRNEICLKILSNLNPDVICLTEAFESSLESFGGYTVTSDPDYGYPIKQGRRKVVLWSRCPMTETDNAGTPNLPSGRFAAGKIDGDFSVDFIGVCIPWSSAHLSTGQRNRQRWEDHLRYLDGLKDIDRFNHPETNTVVFGDFNHRTSGKFARKDVHLEFKKTFQEYEILTGDLQDTDGRAAIDHIAVQGNLAIVDRGIISRFNSSGKELTDHFGTWCDIESLSANQSSSLLS